MRFERKLLSIKSKLCREPRSKEELYSYYISNRLTKSLMTYREELENSIRYLNQRKPENVLKRIGSDE